MNSFIKWMDSCPLILKIILALPGIDLVWGIYRLIKAVARKNTIALVIDIVLFFVGVPFVWLIDIVTLLLKGCVIDFVDFPKV